MTQNIVFPKLDWPQVDYGSFKTWQDWAKRRDQDMSNLVRQLDKVLSHQQNPIDIGYSTGAFTRRKALPDTSGVTLAQLADFVATHTQSELASGRLGS